MAYRKFRIANTDGTSTLVDGWPVNLKIGTRKAELFIYATPFGDLKLTDERTGRSIGRLRVPRGTSPGSPQARARAIEQLDHLVRQKGEDHVWSVIDAAPALDHPIGLGDEA